MALKLLEVTQNEGVFLSGEVVKHVSDAPGGKFVNISSLDGRRKMQIKASHTDEIDETLLESFNSTMKNINERVKEQEAVFAQRLVDFEKHVSEFDITTVEKTLKECEGIDELAAAIQQRRKERDAELAKILGEK